jgi:hypothetical protein
MSDQHDEITNDEAPSSDEPVTLEVHDGVHGSFSDFTAES